MNIEYHEDYWDLAEYMFRSVLEGEIVTVIGDFWTIEDIFKKLIIVSESEDVSLSIDNITEFGDPDYTDYDAEFMLSVDEDSIFIERALNEKGEPYENYADTVCIQAEFGEKYTPSVSEGQIILITDDKEEYEALSKAPKLNLITDNQNKLKGFTFEDNYEGNCFSISLCTCGDDDKLPAEKILDMAESMINIYTKSK